MQIEETMLAPHACPDSRLFRAQELNRLGHALFKTGYLFRHSAKSRPLHASAQALKERTDHILVRLAASNPAPF